MPSRFQDAEKLAATVREQIPAVAIDWLAAVRKEMEKLTRAALRGDVTDAEFRAMVEATSKRLPELLAEMDHQAIAGLMETGMGAAMGNGIASRSVAVPATPKKAKLPREKAVLLASGKGKRCGNSWIPRWKQCGKNDGREWAEAGAEDAAVLQRLTGHPFKAGARILATPDGIRHAEKGHKHQLSEKDWKQLRGRLFDPRTDRETTRSKNHEAGIAFRFLRGTDRMEAVFTIHFPHQKSPGELRLKTFAQRG